MELSSNKSMKPVHGFRLVSVRVKGALQLLSDRYGYILFAQVPERVSTKNLVVLIIGKSKSFHIGAQGTFNQRNIRGGLPSP